MCHLIIKLICTTLIIIFILGCQQTEKVKLNKQQQQWFSQYCLNCHGSGQSDRPQFAQPQTWPSTQLNKQSAISSVIQGKGMMPAKGGCWECRSSDLAQMTQYMLYSLTSEYLQDSTP